MDLSANICGLKFDPAWINGSGVFTSPYRLKKVMEYGLPGGVLKTTGLEPRPGNLEPTIAQVTEDTFINAMSLPNPGYMNLRDDLKELGPFPNPLIGSVYGNTEDEIVEVAKGIEDYCDAIELNFSCPNIRQGESSGVTIGRDPERVGSFVRSVKKSVKKPVIAKLTYVHNIGDIAREAERAGADAISAINTIPDGMLIDIYAKRAVLTSKFGGVSGPGIKSLAVGSVYKIYDSVKIPIIGGGGVATPYGIVEMVEAGADVVSMATIFHNYGTGDLNYLFEGMKQGVGSIVEEIGASSLRELKGAAHG